MKTLELRTYQLGKARTQVVVESVPDAISAYGLLTFYQTPAMTPEKGIQLAVSDAKETLMARGNNFIRFLHGKDSPTSRKRLPGAAGLCGRKQTVGNCDGGFAPPYAAKGIGAG